MQALIAPSLIHLPNHGVGPQNGISLINKVSPAHQKGFGLLFGFRLWVNLHHKFTNKTQINSACFVELSVLFS